jgi:hypothetical protein
MMLPLRYAGPAILNCRTYPIRISNKKYIGKDGKHLTWDEVQAGVEHEVYEGNSGPGYDDQEEISWEEITANSGSPEQIIELTSVTKLPRRAFSFSKKNLVQATRYNDTGHGVYLSVNFANYVDYEMQGLKGHNSHVNLGDKTCLGFDDKAHVASIMPSPPRMKRDGDDLITPKFGQWVKDNIVPVYLKTGARLKFIGTGPNTDEMITL